MKLQKNSWHYKLNNFIQNDFYFRDYTDFCSYFWLTVSSIFKTIFFTIVLGLLLTAGVMNWQATLIILGSVTGVILLLVTSVYSRKKLENTEPGFIRASYRKFRDKTCHKVEWQ